MITILNRKELISTFSLTEQTKIREILSQNHIDYSIKVVNEKSSSPFSSGSRLRTGTMGENLAQESEYIIFVKKEDFEEAKKAISH